MLLLVWLSALSALKCPESGLQLSPSDIDDDYCDCPISGFDEPNTSACPNGVFLCANEGFRSREIPSYMVKDGVCDCCDGSDEPSGKCVDSCAAEREAVEQQERLKREKVEKGLLQQSVMQEQARLKKEELAGQHKDLLLRIQQLSLRVQVEKEETEDVDTLKERIKELEAEIEQLKENPTLRAMEKGGSWWGKVLKSQVVSTITETVTRTIFSQPTNKYSETERGLNEARRELEEVKQAMERDYGPDNLRMAWLGKCFQLVQDKYTYEVCPYGKATQSEANRPVTLGEHEVDDEDGLRFKNGFPCWNGPSRSLLVRLECGPEDRLLRVTEPAKCEYEAVMETPLACF